MKKTTKAKTKTTGKISEAALRAIALRYPEAEEAVACKGTALECSAYKARGKTFLFVSAAQVRLKLLRSLEEAKALAASEPGKVEAGAQGWVKVSWSEGGGATLATLERWIDESYRLLAHAKLVAQLPASTPPE